MGKGIKAVIGFKKGGSSQIQSLLFPKKMYTLAQAKAWVKAHNYHVAETVAYLVTDIIIDPETKELVLEETVATDYDSIPDEELLNMKEDVFKWLMEE